MQKPNKIRIRLWIMWVIVVISPQKSERLLHWIEQDASYFSVKVLNAFLFSRIVCMWLLLAVCAVAFSWDQGRQATFSGNGASDVKVEITNPLIAMADTSSVR